LTLESGIFILQTTKQHMGHIMRKAITWVLLVSFLIMSGISGCGTVAGVGKDIQKGGKAIEDAANS
jgi:predicted small secreted protein